MKKAITALVLGCAPLLLATTSQAQFDPASGEWGKTEATDLRIMTWNVQDGLCSTNPKTDALNNWNAIVRIVADLRPDVLLLQETADNSGNGTGGGVDSVGNLLTTLELFMHGGTDPFLGGSVTSFVQSYAPSYDLPFIFVSGSTDGFNRNVVMSRYPFVDLNGDTRSQQNDTPFMIADLYSAGGTGGIRGFQIAEIDLDDSIYDGDIVVCNSHLKSGGDGGSQSQRITASQNIAYYVDYLLNGAGTGTPDPRNKIIDNPVATTILSPETPVVLGGDWNEDEQSNGRRGPADWITRAEFNGSDDGTDRDLSDSVYDDAREPFSNSRATQSSSKLDYISWQDSICGSRNEFIFNSSSVPAGLLPPAVDGYTINGNLATTFASDHRPVIVDLQLSLSNVPTMTVSGNTQIGQTLTFTLDGPPNAAAGFILGSPGTLMRAGLTFCAVPPFDVIQRPMVLRTDASGMATVQWTVQGPAFSLKNAHAAVKVNGSFVPTNCISLVISP